MDARRLLPVEPGLWGNFLVSFFARYNSSLFTFFSTAAAAVVRGSIRRLRELADI